MVMSCCDRCYEQYIDADGLLTPEFVEREYPKHIIGYSAVAWNKSGFKREDDPYIQTDILIKGRVGDRIEVLCTCACHVVGCCVMH
jgi:hypothetical protein